MRSRQPRTCTRCRRYRGDDGEVDSTTGGYAQRFVRFRCGRQEGIDDGDAFPGRTRHGGAALERADVVRGRGTRPLRRQAALHRRRRRALSRDRRAHLPTPWAVQQIWTLEAGGRADEWWCGTLPGGLFHTTDRGATWSLVEALWRHPMRTKWFGGGYDFPGIHSICVDPRNADCVTIAVSCGGVWRTEDGGKSWQTRGRGLRAAYMPPELADDPATQDPHRMVQCAAAPDHFWIQHHTGIFHSTNHAAASQPREAGGAWFVPAEKDQCRVPVQGRCGVMRTTDGGKTFELLTEGLPAAPAYHLVYRHGRDIDRTGEVLAMGSTTGSLWLGRDGGERWARVSAELPPINTVRFCP